jgi:PAS domain S-box-containing protein
MALLGALLGWFAREALTSWLGPTKLPFISFFPAVALSAWFGGFGPGLVCTALSALLADWFFFEPLGSLAMHDPVPIAAFLCAALLITVGFEAMHRSRKRLLCEIARRRDAEAELIQAHDLLSTTLASIGDGVIVTDAQGQVTYLNPEAERLTGWKVALAKQRPLSQVFRIINDDTRQTAENPVSRALREGTVVGLANHTLLVAKDGTETPIDDSGAPIRRPDRSIVGVVLVFRDATEQRQAALARGRLAAIVESSGDAIISKTLEGRVQTWNEAAEALFGYRAQEIVGKPITLIIPPEQQQEEEQILETIRKGGSVRLDTIRLAKDGRRIPVSIRISPVRDKEDRIVGASKILNDRTELVTAQEALWREKEFLRSTLASIGDGVIATDEGGRVTFMNPVAEILTGWEESAARARLLTEVFRVVNETSRAEVENPALRAMREGVIVGLANHSLLLSRSGEERPIDDSAAPIMSQSREVLGSVLVFRDVTERRRTEAELRASREKLLKQAEALIETDRQKNNFIALLAHELRNPLAPMRNSITVLQMKGSQDPDLVWAREVIERQVRIMARLLDDLLDINRLVRNKLELRREILPLAPIIENAIETSRPVIDQARHRLTVEVPAEPIYVDGDPVRLAQVFCNVLNNAAKYTDPGGHILMRATRRDDQVVVSVKDDGIGIDPATLLHLFDMFATIPTDKDRSQGGIGIGLAIAKGLTEQHGGSIEAHSAGRGKGSEFVVRLPICASPSRLTASIQGTGAAPRILKQRIVIADDLRDNADSLALMLRTLGYHVHSVYDGEQAVRAAAELRPDVMLLDIGMPKLDGYEVCRQIRSQPWGRNMLLIAQTGWGHKEDLRRAAEAGFDHHLLKPVEIATLLDLLASYAQGSAFDARNSSPGSAGKEDGTAGDGQNN